MRSARYPIRAGTHANTAFACLLACDYASACGDHELRVAIRDAAVRWYGDDRDAQPAFEPSLTDFLSPILCEAALVATLSPAEANFEPALPHTVGGDSVGEHWLASFAALALGEVP